VCGGPTSKQSVNRRGWSGDLYSCLKKRCAAVSTDILDEYVQRAMVAWLSRPDIYEVLSAQTATDADMSHACAEAARLRTDLEGWRKLAGAGDVTPISFARAEKGLLSQIAEHDARVTQLSRCPSGSAGAQSLR